MTRAAKFDWDDANTGPIARHGATEEVAQAFANHPLVMLATQKRRGAHTAKRKVMEKL